MLLTFTAEQTNGKTTAGIDGAYSPQDALAALLSGSGLQAVSLGQGGYVLKSSPSGPDGATQSEALLPTVRVVGRAGGNGLLANHEAKHASHGALGSRAPLDTPFSVSVVTADEIADRQVSNLADALRNDAAVIASSNPIARENSMITVRGLPVDLLNGYKIDGLNVSPWNADLPIEHFEQVELLKGLSGFMYGFAAPGGIVNHVLKRAGASPVTTLSAGMGTSSQHTIALDLGRRFSDDSFGARLNVVHEAGDSYLDLPVQRNSVSMATDLKLSHGLTLAVDALYQKRKVNGSMFAMVLGSDVASMPSPVDGGTRLTQDFTYHQTEMRSTGVSLGWDLNQDWKLSAAVRNSLLKRTNHDSYLIVDDDVGNYTDLHLGWYSEHHNRSANMVLGGQFTTGSIGHVLNVGADLQMVKRKGGTDVWNVLAGGNLYTGRGQSMDPGVATPTDLRTTSESRNAGLFVSDTVMWSPQWSTVFGVRRSDYRKTQPEGPSYDKSQLTPTLAVMWKPIESLTAYASYVEALEEGNTAPTGTVNADEVFGPLESRQYEVGVKRMVDVWSFEAALFRIERGLAYTNSANFHVQEGGLIYQGLDLSGRAELGRNWALRGGVQLLHSKNKSDDAAVNDKDGTNAPRFSARVQVDHKLPIVSGMTVSAGVRHVGSRYLEANNTHQMGSYTLFDLGVRHVMAVNGQQLTLRAKVDNLSNEKYWQAHGDWGFITPGEPRTFRISAQLAFH